MATRKRRTTGRAQAPPPDGDSPKGTLRFPPWPAPAADEAETAERARFDVLVATFQRGDYLTVRRQATALQHTAASEEVRRRCADLLARLRPDPLALIVAGGALGIWVLAMVLSHL